jgi:von Willebrand factor type A domain
VHTLEQHNTITPALAHQPRYATLASTYRATLTLANTLLAYLVAALLLLLLLYCAIGDGMYDLWFNHMRATTLRATPPKQVFLVVITDGLQNQGKYNPAKAVELIKADFNAAVGTNTTLTFVAVGVNEVNNQTLLDIADGQENNKYFVQTFSELGNNTFAGRVSASITKPCASNVAVSFNVDPDATLVPGVTTTGFTSSDNVTVSGSKFTVNIASLDSTARVFNYTLDVCGCSKAPATYDVFTNYTYTGVQLNGSLAPVPPTAGTFSVALDPVCTPTATPTTGS